MKFVLAGGGTGGHVYPGLALGDALVERGCGVFYLTDPRAAGYFAAAGTEAKLLSVTHLSRTGVTALAVFAMRMLIAFCQSVLYLGKCRPDVVVGLGGFVSFPPLLAARLLFFKTAILEQNSVPGLVTRLFARWVGQVHLAYDESARFLPSQTNVSVSGNPVRKSVLAADRDTNRRELGLDPGVPAVAVMGGSQGAHKINTAIAEWFGTGANPLGIKFLVVTGKDDAEMVKAEAVGVEPTPEVYPFLQRIDRLLSSCDLVVSRAGAMAVAEITALGLPAVFVPYPYAKADHQRLNVESLRVAGGCWVIDDGELDGSRLRREVESLLGDPEELSRMRVKSREAGRPRAAEDIAESLLELAGKAKN
jgi:UDP-N-acetylglucosamine--N-acetylmuramyl-(pentapeptide) pyrophosphoryl-undecaprenol N-acetylglucosamine transferase